MALTLECPLSSPSALSHTHTHTSPLPTNACTRACVPARHAAAAAATAPQLQDEAGPAALARLTRLQSLDLSCSSISSVGLLHLSSLSGLTQLLLDMCHIGDEACRVRPFTHALLGAGHPQLPHTLPCAAHQRCHAAPAAPCLGP